MISREARLMLRTHRYGALCTLSKKFSGYPFGSITPYLVDHDGSLLVLISDLAEHTKNIRHDPRVSLITHDPHIQSQGRVTVIGDAEPEPDRQQAGIRYIRYFPDAQAYLGMGDFSFFRISPIAIRYIGGFGKIHWIDMEKYAVAQAESFAKHEEEPLAEVNKMRQPVLQQLLQEHHRMDYAEVQAIGLDCDGLDARCGGKIWRLDFPETMRSPSLDALNRLNRRSKDSV